MIGHSLTIGRGEENDLCLPDPDRTLSKRHCAIEDHNGNVIVVDFSTNGTFLNYGKLPLGAVPTPLNDGDILSLGPYELLVSISSGQAEDDRIADPLEDGPVSHGAARAAPSPADLLDAPGDGGDFLDDLLTGREGPVGPRGVQREEVGEDGLLPPLGEEDDILPPAPDDMQGQGASQRYNSASAQDHFQTPRTAGPASVIPDDWEDDLAPSKPAGDASDPFAQPMQDSGSGGSAFIPDDFDLDGPQDPTPEPPPAPEEPAPRDPAPLPPHLAPDLAPDPAPDPAPDEAEPPTPAPAPAPASATGGDAAARVFLKSLGAEEVKVSDEELTPTMSRLGHVLRIMVEGMREILMTRTSIKSEFRIEQTMIQAGGNNPLKFSISPEQAIEAMVKPSAKGYLDATEAANQALRDIKAHEVAMVTGMEAALKGVLKRLDPAALEEKIKVGGGFSSVLKSKKARYWEVYETMYAEISDQAENDFQELFAKEFARAYKEQLDKLK
ncbi:FHA domain protein, putative [Pseudooceanicola batsensis HTCC2597]|uniref:FHA domain protein, putative n=1 Tax=Pseudooceanicola batsensis (strain ATCC BAA-863 / DSM 15984 / KCTC 12145 / HTCC2597) TaxID=252305 RepID=A3TYC6_PSEBH|nr:type VI secretion system-associated FHA domain protein TagH [Pseudooceanicola batsensis]EAQ03160.1 FHA domain protein, putative [Pseudooceanicola batsensis HTCC2597]